MGPSQPVDEGNPILLTCDVTGGSDNVQVDWLNGALETIASGRAFSVIADSSQHEATYYCRVGTSTDSIELAVNC